MNDRVRKWLRIFLIGILLIGAVNLARQGIHQRAASAANGEARQLAQSTQPAKDPVSQPIEPESQPSEPPVQTTAATEPQKKIWAPAPLESDDADAEQLAGKDLNALREVNADVIGWICIPDTPVDYPLMHGQDNTYYLEHTWDGIASVYGSIFLECMNGADLADFHSIVYGHNMRDNSMFGSLNEYATMAHWEDHPYIYIVTDAGVLRYEVYSTYLADVPSFTYVLSSDQPDWHSEFLQMTLEKSEIQTGIIPAETDRILTLSTCTGMGYAQRRVVHARLPMIETEERT